jgi:putative transposase
MIANLNLKFIKNIGQTETPFLKTSRALEALRMAYWRQKPAKGVIHHSDRGSQYAAHDYVVDNRRANEGEAD